MYRTPSCGTSSDWRLNVVITKNVVFEYFFPIVESSASVFVRLSSSHLRFFHSIREQAGLLLLYGPTLPVNVTSGLSAKRMLPTRTRRNEGLLDKHGRGDQCSRLLGSPAFASSPLPCASTVPLRWLPHFAQDAVKLPPSW